ncbi:hypothetical protein [Egicoccus halophilus]|uniref:Right handed beta helix region n=1 Tax=Egicoccus halophilus TaxID=1670830 RepID=A0A8J3AE36_9ACTN|nr:hypothetical protein [Egicoccus halophilus]GGI05286.1 hypothetical protein GCM10011354_13340 [Egicoccus halophilus]
MPAAHPDDRPAADIDTRRRQAMAAAPFVVVAVALFVALLLVLFDDDGDGAVPAGDAPPSAQEAPPTPTDGGPAADHDPDGGTEDAADPAPPSPTFALDDTVDVDELSPTDPPDDRPGDFVEVDGHVRAATDFPSEGEVPVALLHPEAFGFPGPRTTGVREAELLEEIDGRVDLDQDGQVFENALVRGNIRVTAQDVVIRNVRLETRAEWGIAVDPEAGGGNLLVEDTTIVGQGDTCIGGIAHARFTARRVQVTNCDDGMRIGPDTTVEDSFVHGLRKSDGDEHNDPLQTTGGSNMVLRNNTLISVWQRQTSSVFLQAIFGTIDDVVVEGNLLAGGSYTLYVESVDQPPATRVVVRDNVFVADSSIYGTHRLDGDAEVTWEGNTTTDGATLE